MYRLQLVERVSGTKWFSQSPAAKRTLSPKRLYTKDPKQNKARGSDRSPNTVSPTVAGSLAATRLAPRRETGQIAPGQHTAYLDLELDVISLSHPKSASASPLSKIRHLRERCQALSKNESFRRS